MIRIWRIESSSPMEKIGAMRPGFAAGGRIEENDAAPRAKESNGLAIGFVRRPGFGPPGHGALDQGAPIGGQGRR